jgi:hypothetical protein
MFYLYIDIHCYTLCVKLHRTQQCDLPLLHTEDRRHPTKLNPNLKRSTETIHPPITTTPTSHYFFPPFFFAATTLKLPFAGSSFGVSGFAGPFFATSLQPPGAAFAGLPLLGGVEVSTRPLSASLLRRMNSSAKWRESMVEELPWTASVMSSASAGKKMRSATNCSAVMEFG